MIKIKFTKEKRIKSYLVKFHIFEFDNLLHLIFELFNNNELLTNETDDIVYKHILSLGYKNVAQIPENIKKELENWYFELLNKYNNNLDYEKETYLLMAKIVSKKVLVTIDNKLIINFQKPIAINKNSVITFNDIDKINNIKFSTI
jgi:hypothetical protein